MKPTKKELKNMINKRGFFAQMTYDIKTNAPEGVTIPDGAIYFEGIASNGELNRNGYIIRPQAWVDAISGYMQNPIILLQHDVDQPIGQALSAQVTSEGLHVTGFVFDDLTGEKFSRGLYKALSTGHYTEAYEFENTETGETLTEEQFSKLPFEEQVRDVWVLAVTKLEWVEFSVVSIGSNRKSLISKKNAILDYMSKNELITLDQMEVLQGEQVEAEVVDGENPEATEVAESEDTTATETPGELPEAEAVADVEDEEENTAGVPEQELNKLKEGSKMLLQNFAKEPELEAKEPEANDVQSKLARFLETNSDCAEYFANLVDGSLATQEENKTLKAEVLELRKLVNNTPISKRVMYSTQSRSVVSDGEQKTNAPFLASKVLGA